MTIPGYSSTGSKRPEALFGVADEVAARAVRSDGCRVWDERGTVFLDLVMALGAVALGYGHPRVRAAAEQAVRDGGVGGLAPSLEARVAERLAAVLPGVEQVRFLKTGAEAVAAAVRLARAATGRDGVVTCGYHGWLDWCADGPGVPAATKAMRTAVPFDDVPALRRALASDPIAAVVVEPVVDAAPSPEWLHALKAEAGAAGAVLIFDEIKTAFRLDVGGAAERYGVVPDLMVVGKALGNGFPIAAVGGRADVMGEATRTWISSTLATEWVSLAAAEAVIDTFADEPVVAHLAEQGGALWEVLAGLAEQHADRCTIRGVPQMCHVEFHDAEDGGAVARAAAARGVLFKRTAHNFVSYAHTSADIAMTADVLADAMHGTRPC